MVGRRRVRCALLALVGLLATCAAAQGSAIDGPGTYRTGDVELRERARAVPPDAAAVPYLREPAVGERGTIFIETVYAAELREDGTWGTTYFATCGVETETVRLPPGRYEIVNDTCTHSWQWVEDKDRYGQSAFGRRTPGPIVKRYEPMTCLVQSYVIEVLDDAALREECPSWHPSEVAPGLEAYRDSLHERHQVQAGLEDARWWLDWCERTERRSTHVACRQARERIKAIEAGLDAYVDDCGRLLGVLEQPGNWQKLQACLLRLGLETMARGLEDHCVSPENVCESIHRNVMSMVHRASDSAQAYRNLPSCLRLLYPSAGVLEDWYTGGRPLDF